MGGFSLWHILIFAVIVLLLFGGNRFSAMMGDVAKGLKSFKQGMSDDDQANNAQQRPADPRQLPPQQPVQQQPIDITPQPQRPVEPNPVPPATGDDSTTR
ncbi:twin-arginine translocase TatA/TatE family subunit [Sphingomonas sp. LY160]|uniref:twin-arginine translocase TatA/TatE family subunit n=1 Tax=Sphingomonas sp. LY160 TaxID=3095342 RepID=UPI002ADED772|nr:twin-arginine translocase TatA/TatE family subunit [Sphingomonas sp. LY160]MEA1071898.1 twin-arginine translocase TatA/TatE family subunit [Sphingomonas sp. LY160]